MDQPAVQEYLDRVVATLGEWLGDGLVGVYVHGSLAMGAFAPGRSDIDVLAVCGEPLSSKRGLALGAALDAIPRPHPVEIWSSAWSRRPRFGRRPARRRSRST